MFVSVPLLVSPPISLDIISPRKAAVLRLFGDGRLWRWAILVLGSRQPLGPFRTPLGSSVRRRLRSVWIDRALAHRYHATGFICMQR